MGSLHTVAILERHLFFSLPCTEELNSTTMFLQEVTGQLFAVVVRGQGRDRIKRSDRGRAMGMVWVWVR